MHNAKHLQQETCEHEYFCIHRHPTSDMRCRKCGKVITNAEYCQFMAGNHEVKLVPVDVYVSLDGKEYIRHTLKTDPAVFDAVKEGRKTFELRKFDRPFEVGHLIRLRKTKYTGAEMAAGAALEYVDAPLIVEITYVLKGPIYGLMDGWAILGIKQLSEVPTVLITGESQS